MTDAPRCSLSQQIEAVRLAETRQRALASGQTVRGLRPQSVEIFDLQRLGAAARTLEWLQRFEDEIRAYLRLPADKRRALVHRANGGAALDAACEEIAAATREAMENARAAS